MKSDQLKYMVNAVAIGVAVSVLTAVLVERYKAYVADKKKECTCNG